MVSLCYKIMIHIAFFSIDVVVVCFCFCFKGVVINHIIFVAIETEHSLVMRTVIQ